MSIPIDKGLTSDEAHQAHQAGVKLELEINGVTADAPVGRILKFCRVGLDNTLCFHAALVHLLVQKGIITVDEYTEQMRVWANNEVARYEQALSSVLSEIKGEPIEVTLHAGPEPTTGQGHGYASIKKI